MSVCFGKVILRKSDLSTDAGQSFRDKRGPAPARLQLFANFADVLRVLRPQFGFAATIESAIIICKRCDVHPGLFPGPTRAVEFVWTDIDQRIRVPVISVLSTIMSSLRVVARARRRARSLA